MNISYFILSTNELPLGRVTTHSKTSFKQMSIDEYDWQPFIKMIERMIISKELFSGNSLFGKVFSLSQGMIAV